jgi:hypothetical protein
MGDNMKYISYLLLVLVVLMAFFPSVYESYVKLSSKSNLLYSEISDDKNYRADIFITKKRPFRIFALQDDASLYNYQFVRLYNNKNGNFIGESNICASREMEIFFPSNDSKNKIFFYGATNDEESKGLFGFSVECKIYIK